MRIIGKEIPDNKSISISLSYIYGIGISRSLKILNKCDIKPNARTNCLTIQQVSLIVGELNHYILEGDLKKSNKENVADLIAIKCYRGIRHIKGFPCRGQRTKTNAKNCKLFKFNR